VRVASFAWVLFAVVACADPEVPRNAATMDTCAGVTAPDGTQLQCMHGSQLCPLPWKGVHACIDQIDNATCMTHPCPMGKAKPAIVVHQGPVTDAGAPMIGAGYADAGWDTSR
jgi:hypothetical protein